MSATPAPRRRRVALWNATFGYATLASTLARNVLLVPLYLGFIALGEYGAWLATGGALVQLLVTDFGLSGVITQRVAMLAGAADAGRMRATILAGLANAVFLGVSLTALSSVIAAFLPATQGLTAEQVTRVTHCFLIAIAANGLGIVAAAAGASLRGLQKAGIAGAITLGADLAGIAMTIIGLLVDLGLYSLALAVLLRSLISAGASLLALAPGLVRDTAGPGFRFADCRELWNQAGRFFVTSIAMRLQTQANILVVGMVLGPQTAAIYALTVRAHETIMQVLWQINAAMGPVLAHLVGAGQQARLDGVVRSLLPITAAIAAVGAACAVVLNPGFVSLWVGAHTFAGVEVNVLMAAALWTTALASVGYEALIARGEFAFIARVYAAASVLHLLVLLSLAPLGAWAAPLALCLSTLAWGGTFWYRIVSRMRLPVRDLRSMAMEPLVILGCAAAATLPLVLLLPRAHSWPLFCAESLLVPLFVAVLLLMARPRLRALLRDELLTTWRSLRAT